MNCYNLLSQAAKENQDRRPGSSSSAAIRQLLNSLASGLKLNPKTAALPVYRFKNSLWLVIVGGLLITFSGYRFPPVGLVGSFFLLLLLFKELNRPLLAKFAAARAENIIVNLPAKNKEIQKVFLLTSYDTESFLETPGNLHPVPYSILIYAIAVLMVLFSLGYLITRLVYLNHLNLLLLSIIGGLNLCAFNRVTAVTLKNCAALLETGMILSKVKPDITSVTLCFCGSGALNSGVIALLPEFAKGPKELTYVINLTETANPEVKQFQLVSSEGPLLSKKANPLLVNAITEVAREKSLAIETIETREFTATCQINRAKINPVTLITPQNESSSVQEVRELLCGLIRKLDH